MNNNTVIFCRVSSKEQEETGYSLFSQEKLLIDYGENHSFDIKKTFSISESASGHKQRQVFNELLKYLYENKITQLLVEKTDRLTRNHKDAVEINKWIEENPEHKVHFVKENFILHKNSKSNDRFIWNVKVSVAEYYIDNLSEETKKGQIEKVSLGWLPGKPPLGYKTTFKDGKSIHELDPNTAPLIKRFFTLYETGEFSLEKLAILLNPEFKVAFGKKLTNNTTDRILKNTYYIGKITWRKETYQGKQTPLVSEELFYKVNKMLSGKGKTQVKKHDHLFRGLIRCSDCGGLITWETQKGHKYGHCNGYKQCSNTKWAREDRIEEEIINAIKPLKIESEDLLNWIRKALKELNRDSADTLTTTQDDLSKKIIWLDNKLNQAYEDKLEGLITKDKYQSLSKEIELEKIEINKQLSKIQNEDISNKERKLNIFDTAQTAEENYKSKEPDKKRILLRDIFTSMTLEEGKLYYDYSNAYLLLKNAVVFTNSSKQEILDKISVNTFEPTENALTETKNGNIFDRYPTWGG